jgi:2-hydroxy-3-keto-5-methylthiopentenyl-1-phosphate phosphatase
MLEDMTPPPPARPRALITDFDGTITRTDFYEVAVARCLAPDTPDYWSEYSAGRITHFEAMAGIYRHIRCPEALIRAEILPAMDIDPALGEAVAHLQANGWDVIVVSNGSLWYIDILLAQAGLESLPRHGNPGRFVDGEGLLLELPEHSPFFSRQHGVDKSLVVADALRRYERVAFAGNGPPDLAPALLVPPSLRFARTWLASAMEERGERFHRYERWSEIVNVLMEKEITT